MITLGIDLGTNSVKSLILDIESGEVLGLGQKAYGYIKGTSAEQDRQYIWSRVIESIKEAIKASNIEEGLITCVGLSGQMHGTVLYDKSGKCISNIITWEDDRCDKEFLREISDIVGDEIYKSGCGIATGFLGPTVYHIIKNSSINIGHVLLPTDWLRQELTGEKTFRTDHSNGSSTGFFDTQSRNWNYGLIDKLELPKNIFPEVISTTYIDGEISKSTAELTGLKAGTPVIIGGGDQPLSMIGSGICNESDGILLNIGTGSQISKVSKKYIKGENTIAFCFPEEGYSILGAGLSGGASLNWWRKISQECITTYSLNLPQTDIFGRMTEIAESIHPGSDGLVFVPYLSGTRVNPDLRANFAGISRRHTYAHFTRAILEGVIFELYNFYENLKTATDDNSPLIGSGGGFSSRLWAQISSDIFNKELKMTKNREQAAFGAGLLAGVGIGYLSNLKETCKIVKYHHDIIHPLKENVSTYKQIYERYRAFAS